MKILELSTYRVLSVLLLVVPEADHVLDRDDRVQLRLHNLLFDVNSVQFFFLHNTKKHYGLALLRAWYKAVCNNDLTYLEVEISRIPGHISVKYYMSGRILDIKNRISSLSTFRRHFLWYFQIVLFKINILVSIHSLTSSRDMQPSQPSCLLKCPKTMNNSSIIKLKME